MDKLSIASLLFLTLAGGSGIGSFILLSQLITGIVPIDHTTLFSLFILLTYSFYGFFGLFYVTLSALVVIGCGLMYWFEMSMDDVKDKLIEMQIQALKTETENNQNNQNNQNNENNENEIQKRIDQMKTMRQGFLTVFWTKTGISEERRNQMFEFYSAISSKFDLLMQIVIDNIQKFKNMTQNIVPFNKLYILIDGLFLFKQSVESLRSMHKLARSVQPSMFGNFQSMPMMGSGDFQRMMDTNESQDSTSIAEIDDDDVLDEPTIKKHAPTGHGSSSNRMPNIDIGSMFGGMPDIAQMQRELESLPASEREKIDKMTKDMLGGMNMDDMMKMMNSFGGMQNNKPGVKKRNNKHR